MCSAESERRPEFRLATRCWSGLRVRQGRTSEVETWARQFRASQFRRQLSPGSPRWRWRRRLSCRLPRPRPAAASGWAAAVRRRLSRRRRGLAWRRLGRRRLAWRRLEWRRLAWRRVERRLARRRLARRRLERRLGRRPGLAWRLLEQRHLVQRLVGPGGRRWPADRRGHREQFRLGIRRRRRLLAVSPDL